MSIITTPPTLAASVAPVPAYQIRAVAVDAQVDPQTVRRVLMGLPTRPACRARIVTALARIGVQVRP